MSAGVPSSLFPSHAGWPAQTAQFRATVTNTSNTAVTWGVSGGSANGTIDANGLYTAPAAVAGSFGNRDHWRDFSGRHDQVRVLPGNSRPGHGPRDLQQHPGDGYRERGHALRCGDAHRTVGAFTAATRRTPGKPYFLKRGLFMSALLSAVHIFSFMRHGNGGRECCRIIFGKTAALLHGRTAEGGCPYASL